MLLVLTRRVPDLVAVGVDGGIVICTEALGDAVVEDIMTSDVVTVQIDEERLRSFGLSPAHVLKNLRRSIEREPPDIDALGATLIALLAVRASIG